LSHTALGELVKDTLNLNSLKTSKKEEREFILDRLKNPQIYKEKIKSLVNLLTGK